MITCYFDLFIFFYFCAYRLPITRPIQELTKRSILKYKEYPNILSLEFKVERDYLNKNTSRLMLQVYKDNIIIIVYSPFSMLHGLDCSRINCGSPCIPIVHKIFIQLVFIQIPIYDLLPRLEGSSWESNTGNNSVRVLYFSQPITIIFP